MRYIAIVLFMLCALGAGAESVLIAAVGDVMLDYRAPEMAHRRGAGWMWAEIAPALRSADLRFCNLETTLTTGRTAVVKPFVFRADPHVGQRILRAGGFDVVSLANNHTYDYGQGGLLDTLRAVEGAGMAAVGAGRTRAQAIAPRVLTVNGVRVGFVAYSWWEPEEYRHDGPALAILDIDTFPEEIRAAKAACDVLVVSMHWGNEYTQAIPQIQREVGHAAIDAGADLILGHHAHVAQEMEWYRDRPIFHSLGNCLFDRHTHPLTPSGLLALIRVAPGKVTVDETILLQIDDVRPLVAQQ